jgi:hypothetical protein
MRFYIPAAVSSVKSMCNERLRVVNQAAFDGFVNV